MLRAFLHLEQLGPGGNFLDAAETREHFRTEHWVPQLASRENPDSWAKKGGVDYKTRVHRATIALLACHQPRALPPSVSAELQSIYETAQEQLAGIAFKT